VGRNGPRISAGASGFGSHVSNWVGPPHIQKRMTDVGGDVESNCARSRGAKGRAESAEAVPTRRNVRREIGPGQARGMSDSGEGSRQADKSTTGSTWVGMGGSYANKPSGKDRG